MQSLIVDGVIDEDMFFLVDGQEMSSVTVLYDLAVGNLDLLQHLHCIVHYREHLKNGGEAHCQKQPTRVH